MLNAVRAMATAAGLTLSALQDERPEDLARFAVSMRRLTPMETASATMEAGRMADMVSLWVGGSKTVCRVRSSYARGARFAGVVRFSTAPAAATAAASGAGARALWDRLKAAGFQVAEEGAAAAAAAATPHRIGATAVRVLKEAPPRERRAVWSDEGARKAA
jgi:hypothetical protein